MASSASAPFVIVPGGGPFADTVRGVQPHLQFTDMIAHRIALLAMHQMGHVIAALNLRFALAASLDEIGAFLAAGRIPVWMPYALQSNDETLPADWTVTSDALAARLAERLGGAPVALVKSCPVPAAPALDQLAAQGVTDPVFSAIVTRAGLDWRIYGSGDEAALASRLHRS